MEGAVPFVVPEAAHELSVDEGLLYQQGQRHIDSVVFAFDMGDSEGQGKVLWKLDLEIATFESGHLVFMCISDVVYIWDLVSIDVFEYIYGLYLIELQDFEDEENKDYENHHTSANLSWSGDVEGFIVHEDAVSDRIEGYSLQSVAEVFAFVLLAIFVIDDSLFQLLALFDRLLDLGAQDRKSSIRGWILRLQEGREIFPQLIDSPMPILHFFAFLVKFGLICDFDFRIKDILILL